MAQRLSLQSKAVPLTLPSPLDQGRGNILSSPEERTKVRGHKVSTPRYPRSRKQNRRKPMTPLFNLSLAGYFAALLLVAAELFAHKRRLAIAGVVLLTAGLLCQTAYIALRWIEAGRAPFSNMFESLVLLLN